MKSPFIIKLKDVVICPEVQNWCRLPYTTHKNGCMYYGKRDSCPPKAFLLNKISKAPYTLVAIKFNLEKHIQKLKRKHPNWSDKQARCVWYFQGTLNKRVREECERIADKDSIIFYRPEAHGVNVFETCRRIGLRLKRNPQKIVWKIGIIGKKRIYKS